MADVYIALIHHPVYDKTHKVVTTSITNMDIHDIARSALTYGVKQYFVVHPVRTLQALAEKILDHWQNGHGSVYNATRRDALSIVSLADSLEEVRAVITRSAGQPPRVIATSAKGGQERLSFADLRDSLKHEQCPTLLLWGPAGG